MRIIVTTNDPDGSLDLYCSCKRKAIIETGPLHDAARCKRHGQFAIITYEMDGQ